MSFINGSDYLCGTHSGAPHSICAQSICTDLVGTHSLVRV